MGVHWKRFLASVYERPPFVYPVERVLSSAAQRPVACPTRAFLTGLSRVAPCGGQLLGRQRRQTWPSANWRARSSESIQQNVPLLGEKRKGRQLAPYSSARPAFISRSLLIRTLRGAG